MSLCKVLVVIIFMGENKHLKDHIFYVMNSVNAHINQIVKAVYSSMTGYFQLLTYYIKENQNPWNIILLLSLSLLNSFLPIFNFSGKLFISFTAASEFHSHQLISNIKITLFFFWEPALGFPQNLHGLRFGIFRWVQLPHPSKLSCSGIPSCICTALSSFFHPISKMYCYSFFFVFFIFFFTFVLNDFVWLLITSCVCSGVHSKFRTSLRYISPKRGCEKEERLEDLYFFLWKLRTLELKMTLSSIFFPRLKSWRNTKFSLHVYHI